LEQKTRRSWLTPRSMGSKPSVVQLRSDNLDPDAIGPKVISALRQLDSELNAGAVVSVDPQGTRMRLLPLRPKD